MAQHNVSWSRLSEFLWWIVIPETFNIFSLLYPLSPSCMIATHSYVLLQMSHIYCNENVCVAKTHLTSHAHGGGVDSMD